MRIAICDDNLHICASIESIVHSYCQSVGLDCSISVFYTASRLVNEISNGEFFDLIFLDIEMDGMDGVEAGSIIRENAPDYNPQIIYISSHENYAMQLFAIRPLHFLIKPIREKDIEEVMGIAIQLQEKKNVYFSFSFERSQFRIKISDIHYFESKGRKVRVIHCHGENIFYSRLIDLQKNEEICKSFISVHKSFLVNSMHIREFHFDHLVLSSGVHIPISQNRRKDVRGHILKSMGGE